MGKKHKEQCIKNKRLSDYYSLYSYFMMQSLFNVYKNWTVHKIYKIMLDNSLFSL